MATRRVETIEGRECEVTKPVCRLCEEKRSCGYGVHVQTSLFLVCREFAAEARGGFELTFILFSFLSYVSKVVRSELGHGDSAGR